MLQYEFNFIWVGPRPMPTEQARSLEHMRDFYKEEAVINLWIMPSIAHPSILKLIELLNLQMQDINTLLTPTIAPNTTAIIELLKVSTLYSGLGDILKWLILTRKCSQNSLTKRFYMEADNIYPAKLEEYLIKGRGLVIHGSYLEGRLTSRADSFYLDVNSEVGIHICKVARTYLEVLLSDRIIKPAIKGTILDNIKNGYSTSFEVIDCFGFIPITLLHMMLLKHWKLIDFVDFEFALTGRFKPRSWILDDDPRAKIDTVDDRTPYSACSVYIRNQDFINFPDIPKHYRKIKAIPANKLPHMTEVTWQKETDQSDNTVRWKMLKP